MSAPTNIEAGPDYVISLKLQPATDLDNYRGTLAFRYPNGWEVKSVTYAGDLSGTATRSTAIENYFATTWESTPPDAVHNGHKLGYKWWAGYSPIQNADATDVINLTMHVDTHGVGGQFYLDFVTGITDPTSPTDPAANGSGSQWELGGDITNAPDGVVLGFNVKLGQGVNPTVVSSDPGSGADDVPVDSVPRVTFSESMAAATINGTNVYVRTAGAGGTKLPATVSFNATTKQATIDLNQSMQFETDYLLVVESDVKDLVGYTMAADYVAPFTTAAEPTAPQVTVRTPAPGAVGVAVGTDVTATFAEAINPATLDEGSFTLERSEGGGWVDVDASVTYSGPTKTAVLDPTDDLEYETQYRATLTTDVEGANGLALPATVSWTFTTAAEPTAPQVTARTPAPGATGVSLGTDVTATFAEAINPSTLDEGSFTLESSQGGGWVDVGASVTYGGPTKTAVLDPTDDLEYETQYRATLTTDVEGANGTPLAAAVSWTFNTGSGPAPAFIDVDSEDPYFAAITGLAAQGIISGYMVGPGVWEFRPDNAVRRAQFAKMIDGSLGLPVTEDDDDSPFTDLGTDILVPSAAQDNLYPHEYVTVAWQNGITTGKTATSFAPYDEISRAQVVTMVVRAAQNLRPGTLATPPAGYVNTWGTSFSSIHGPNARIAEYNGLLAGLPLTTFASDPWASMPRGEVAQVLWNMMGMTP